jgi:hypothetical protein
MLEPVPGVEALAVGKKIMPRTKTTLPRKQFPGIKCPSFVKPRFPLALNYVEREAVDLAPNFPASLASRSNLERVCACKACGVYQGRVGAVRSRRHSQIPFSKTGFLRICTSL